MTVSLQDYESIIGKEAVAQLYELAKPLQGARIVNINSTKVGGGVAEILFKMEPLMQSVGLRASWEIIDGDADFFACTKSFHNGIQGDQVSLSKELLDHYEKINQKNAEKLKPLLNDADFVIIHDPQPAALIEHFPSRKGKWVWRCHIDASRPDNTVWQFLRKWIVQYDASIFTLPEFTHPLDHPIFLIPPSIDPLTDKNRELPTELIDKVAADFGIDRSRPMILQVSRFDRFKDPIGVIKAYRIAKKSAKGLQLVLAGGSASDDPEGEEVLKEVREAAGSDPDIKVLLLAPDTHLEINALQRAADIIVQKSVKEGFGLTVTEGLWKAKPVIGGNVGGIRLQVKDEQTGYLVNTPEGAATAIRYLLENKSLREKMGKNGKELVRDQFLITRHLRDYLALMLTLQGKVKI